MRKTVTILGFGDVKSGISKKTQKPYEFREVCIGIPYDWYHGMKTEQVILNKEVASDHDFVVGKEMDMEIFFIDNKPRVVAVYG